jgi:hypothetical protein
LGRDPVRKADGHPQNPPKFDETWTFPTPATGAEHDWAVGKWGVFPHFLRDLNGVSKSIFKNAGTNTGLTKECLVSGNGDRPSFFVSSLLSLDGEKLIRFEWSKGNRRPSPKIDEVPPGSCRP